MDRVLSWPARVLAMRLHRAVSLRQHCPGSSSCLQHGNRQILDSHSLYLLMSSSHRQARARPGHVVWCTYV